MTATSDAALASTYDTASTATPDTSTQAPVASPVWSCNEWDPLEEVIVGRTEGASIPPWHLTLKSTAPQEMWEMIRQLSGKPVPEEVAVEAGRELEGLIGILEDAGVTIRRPEPLPQTEAFRTPEWECEAGFNLGNPRDLLLVVADEVIEAPGAWRSRYFELNAYKSLLNEYFRAGARWTAAPRPRLPDELYDESWTLPGEGEPPRPVVTEVEPVFDAASVARCGRDLVVLRDYVTNELGIEWLRRHLEGRFRVHALDTTCRQPMHIDTTLAPLAPGKLMINPDFVRRDLLPACFGGWEVREAPRPIPNPTAAPTPSSQWLSINVLALDHERVIVEAQQRPLIDFLAAWGFDPIPCPFAHYALYGGGFHCATLDTRRRGTLDSYA